MLFLIEVHLEYLSFEVKWSLMLQRFYIGSAKGNKETKKKWQSQWSLQQQTNCQQWLFSEDVTSQWQDNNKKLDIHLNWRLLSKENLK